jgi:LysR family transcriptional regulator, hydrogen peroxide-inducible genes activator
MKRVAKLTPHGETFLPHAVRILEEVEAAKREAVDAQMLTGRIGHLARS